MNYVKQVVDTFKRDMEQGFKTADKAFAVTLLEKALEEFTPDDAKDAAEALRTYVRVAPHPVNDEFADKLKRVAAFLEKW